jgi:hypothetical protein
VIGATVTIEQESASGTVCTETRVRVNEIRDPSSTLDSEETIHHIQWHILCEKMGSICIYIFLLLHQHVGCLRTESWSYKCSTCFYLSTFHFILHLDVLQLYSEFSQRVKNGTVRLNIEGVDDSHFVHQIKTTFEVQLRHLMFQWKRAHVVSVELHDDQIPYREQPCFIILQVIQQAAPSSSQLYTSLCANKRDTLYRKTTDHLTHSCRLLLLAAVYHIIPRDKTTVHHIAR